MPSRAWRLGPASPRASPTMNKNCTTGKSREANPGQPTGPRQASLPLLPILVGTRFTASPYYSGRTQGPCGKRPDRNSIAAVPPQPSTRTTNQQKLKNPRTGSFWFLLVPFGSFPAQNCPRPGHFLPQNHPLHSPPTAPKSPPEPLQSPMNPETFRRPDPTTPAINHQL